MSAVDGLTERQWARLFALRCAYVRGLRDEFAGPSVLGVYACAIGAAYIGPPTTPTPQHARQTFRMEAIQ